MSSTEKLSLLLNIILVSCFQSCPDPVCLYSFPFPRGMDHWIIGPHSGPQEQIHTNTITDNFKDIGHIWGVSAFFNCMCTFLFFFILFGIYGTFWYYICYYRLLQTTTGYYRQLQGNAGYYRLLQITSSYFRLLQVTTFY